MTIGAIYLFLLIPAIALIAGAVAMRSTERSAQRVRALEAERRIAAGHSVP